MSVPLVLISTDPIGTRVFSRLLQSRGFDVRAYRDADTLRGSGVPSASVVLLDYRVGWGDIGDLRGLLGSAPVVLLHHGQCESLGGVQREHRVVATIDASGSTFEAMVGGVLKGLRAAASDDLPNAVPAEHAAQAHEEANEEAKRPAAAVFEAIPGRVAVGRVVESSAPLRWHELYRDQGRLAEELQTGTDGQPASPGQAPKFERRLSKSEVLTRVAEYSQARPLKSTVSMALRLARDSSATVEDMARVVKQDQALAARVLQLANSSLHRRGSAVRTVEQAIVRMGVSALRETISSSNVLDQFEDDTGVLNVPLLWEHGYAVGMLAADLARATRTTPPDDAFMIGLLHDMGRAVMACELGEEYIDALLQARRHDLKPAQVEKQYFEINHADVADTLFANWEFDAAITAPVANHHLSDRNLNHLASVHARQTKLLQAADTLAHAALMGDSGSDWIDVAALDLSGSPISPGLLRSCLQRAEKTLEEIRLLNASAHEPPMGGYAAHLRSQLPKNTTLGWAEYVGELDLMGVLAWSLGGHTTPEPPVDAMLATIRTNEELDRVARSAQVHDAPDHPVPLVLSVHGDPLRKETEERFSDRPTRLVPQSFRVSWVLAGLKSLLEAP